MKQQIKLLEQQNKEENITHKRISFVIIFRRSRGAVQRMLAMSEVLFDMKPAGS